MSRRNSLAAKAARRSERERKGAPEEEPETDPIKLANAVAAIRGNRTRRRQGD